VDEARWEFGRIDVAVNNAGYGLLGAFEDLDDIDLRDQLETNLFGALAVTRAVLPLMRRQGTGHLVQISSVNGIVPGPGGSAYVMSKFALEGFGSVRGAGRPREGCVPGELRDAAR
jgi:NAD(P)-dependent dehydrogenase (short-subunit alcohol dehydrogenase family)